MTALERLRLAAGPGGTTGDALKRMGRGAGLAAGALLVAYSGLASATAAQHLLYVADQSQQVYGGGPHRSESDDELRLLVEAKWEAIEQARIKNWPIKTPDSADTGAAQPARTADAVPADAVDLLPIHMDLPGPLASRVQSSAVTQTASPAASTQALPQADDTALQRKRAQQRAALLLLIDELV